MKYHLGASSDREFDQNKVHLSLTANPSHLEIVDPVVLGKVRAKQDQHGATPEDRTMVMPLLIHGDAVVRRAGRGRGMLRTVRVCAAIAPAARVHFIVNNQIGFTTNPRYSRSSPYPSDVAKMIEAPIFHVNGDDPEAVVFAAKIATEFRQKFQKPVVIDMFCYRRHGHNEGDEPSFTQPLMYKAIARASDHARNLRQQARRRGRRHRRRSREDEGGLARAGSTSSSTPRRATAPTRPTGSTAAGPASRPPATPTIRAAAIPASRSPSSRRSAQKITTLPPDFHLHRTLNRFLDNRRKAIETGAGIDWSTGEALAFCSLLLDGHRVRLSGQDSERGTFSQRHSVLIDQETENRYTPFNHLARRPGAATKSSIRCCRKRPCSASSTAIRWPSPMR